MKFVQSVIIIIFVLAITAIPVYADGMHPRGIQLDGTLGNAGKLDMPGPNYNIKAEYGQQAGTNLFHSFHQFNIHSDETATFIGPSSLENIISRVTGGNSSWIDGQLRSDIAGANLYLLNPAGVMFGPNASLDLGGSFHVSTADYLRLGENDRFYTMPHASDVFSVAPPAAFGFLDSDIGPITYEGRGEITEQEYEDNPVGLRVKEGRTISLIGGNIEINRGTYYKVYETDAEGNLIYEQDTDEWGDPAYEIETDADGEPIYDEDGRPLYKLDETGEYIPIYVYDENGNPIPVIRTEYPGDVVAPGGRIDIASVASEGEVIPTESDLNITSSERGNITIRDNVSADVSGNKGGSVFIRGGRFELTGSCIKSYTWGDQDGGVIDIHADNSDVQDSKIGVDAEGIGKGSDIVLKSADTLNLSNTLVYADAYGEGDAGNIEMEAEEIALTHGTQVFSTAHGSGNSADISLRAADTLMLSGVDEDGYGAVVASDSGNYETRSEGNAGQIDLEARQITLTDGASVANNTFGTGKGGDIVVRVADTLILSGTDEEGYGSRIYGNTEGDSGNAGQIDIEARQIALTGGAEIQAITKGAGQGGQIIIKVADTLGLSEGSSIFTNSEGGEDDADNAGQIEIEARQVTLTDNTQIASTTFGPGQGGDIIIKVTDDLMLTGTDEAGDISDNAQDEASGIFTNAEGKDEGGAGNAGRIEIEARRIMITDGLEISTSTFGPGRGGTIVINATNRLTVSGNKGIFSRSKGTDSEAGPGGTISLSAQAIILTDKGRISTSSDGAGSAGDIDLNADILQMDNNTSVSSASKSADKGGDAGTITVNAADSVKLIKNSALTTEAQGAGGGKIFVNAGGQIYLLNGHITSSVKLGEGKGGDVTTESEFVILNRGNITANAEEGDGGAIFIRTSNYLKSSDGKVTATSRRGNDGTVRIEAPDTDISGELTILPGNYIDATRWMKTPCATRSGENRSRFVIKGQDAAPTPLDDWHPSPLTRFENRDKDGKKTGD